MHFIAPTATFPSWLFHFNPQRLHALKTQIVRHSMFDIHTLRSAVFGTATLKIISAPTPAVSGSRGRPAHGWHGEENCRCLGVQGSPKDN